MFAIEPISLTEPGPHGRDDDIGIGDGGQRPVGGGQRHLDRGQPGVRIGHPQVPIEEQVVVLGHLNGTWRSIFTGGSLMPLTMMPTVTLGPQLDRPWR